jgi:hypothetical protein
MKAEDLIGQYPTGCGTVQELIDVLMQMTPTMRRSSYVRLVIGDDVYDLAGVGLAQSDQMEAHTLKVYIKAEENNA